MAAIFTLSKALSFTFREVVASGTLPTFDNVFWANEEQPFGMVKGYCQQFLATDTIKVQVKTNYETAVVATIRSGLGSVVSTPAITKVGLPCNFRMGLLGI